MKRALIACLVLTLPASAQQFGLPSRVENPSYDESGPDRRPFVWVTGSELFDAEGNLKVDAPSFPERFWLQSGLFTLRRGHELRLRDGTHDCIGGMQIIDYGRYPYERAEVDALMQSVSSLVAGRVVASQAGYVFGDPGIMLEVTVDPVRSLGDQITEEGAVYVHYPAARVSLGDVTICLNRRWGGRGGTNWPSAPVVGDRVAVFPSAREAALHPDFPIYRLDHRGYEFLFEHDGKLQAPYVLREEFFSVGRAESFDIAWSRLSEAFGRVHPR